MAANHEFQICFTAVKPFCLHCLNVPSRQQHVCSIKYKQHVKKKQTLFVPPNPNGKEENLAFLRSYGILIFRPHHPKLDPFWQQSRSNPANSVSSHHNVAENKHHTRHQMHSSSSLMGPHSPNKKQMNKLSVRLKKDTMQRLMSNATTALATVSYKLTNNRS